MARTRLGLIWAQAHGGVIGKNGTMPWHLPEDLAHFKRTTFGAPVIMGRRTWESLPDRARPLPGRTNIVVSRNGAYDAPGATVVSSVEAGLAAADAANAGVADPIVWNIGGAELFRASMATASEIVVTRIQIDIEAGDTLAPEIGPEWELVSRGDMQQSKSGLKFLIERWQRASERG